MKRLKRWHKLLFTLSTIVVLCIAPLHIANDRARARAIMLALQDHYQKSQYPVAYIHQHPLLPEGLTKVGDHPIEVVTVADLKARYAGQTLAPSIIIISIDEHHDWLGIHTSVSLHSTSVLIPGQNAWPHPSTHSYDFRQWGTLPWNVGVSFLTQ